MSDWFRRNTKNIQTHSKRDTKEGMWQSCPECRAVIYQTVLRENSFVCHECLFHFRISSDDYIHLLIDNNEYEEFSKNIISCDPLKFTIPKDYSNQIKETIKKTKKNSAITTIKGRIVEYACQIM